MTSISDREMLARFCGASGVAQDPPKVVVIVAHPDDETLGLAGRLPYLPDITIVHVTDGSPHNLADARAAGFGTREEYANARRQEFVAALSHAGISLERTREIGLVDQEASQHLPELTWTFVSLLRDLQPDVVVTHPYEGGHPDHDATAFATHASCHLLRRQGEWPPVLIEMTSYHNRHGRMALCEFLPHAGCESAELPLTQEQKALKKRMIASFSSQQYMLQLFPVDREAFRLAPRYVFLQPPHEGALFYEGFDWGMRGERWRELAGAAAEELGLLVEA